ncbi:wall-associated receptor kinase-like 20 [Rutidosis leptorrhynchoides]|uniref:wall-associated receptor kinase-like 20 n=1 Tax=Rutidosis leptorrhynchoides TaxID=125765 RepID=UPI003A997A41
MAATSVFAIILTVVMLTCTSLATAATPCPNCGSTQVPYPLSTGSGCGDQSYRVRCNTPSGALFFDTLNNTYPITTISKTTQRFTIQPPNFLNDNKTCVTSDVSSEGLQLDPSLPFNITSGNTIMYLNCSDTLLKSPLNCTSTSLCHTYINNSVEASSCSRAPICCTFRSGGSSTMYAIRVRDGGCQAYRSFVNLDYSLPVTKWPEPGVEIQWVSPPEPVCSSQSDCDRSSSCGLSGSSGVRRCLCNNGLHWDAIEGVCALDDTCENRGDCNDSKRTALIAGLTSGLGSTLAAVVIGLLLYKRHLRHKEAQARLAREREEILNSGGGKTAKVFTGKQIKKATNNFAKDHLLGTGGFGEVYKGILEDSTLVAVKCAKVGNTKGTDQVLNEVRILCQVNHKGLVRLLGCCVELEQPLLVYEYISNGTLLDHLKGQRGRGLTWADRLYIARDTAEGLAYLHFSSVPPIYHRDVKSSNILLDEKLKAKVADFGLSRLAEADLSHVTTCAQGTLGYLDPEYYRNYQLTDKSDVYSFGVVLLELLTSQKAIDFNRPPDDVNLAIYVKRLVDEEKLLDAVDPNLKKGASELELETMKALGFLAIGCLEERRQNRPSMKEVTEEIEYIISIATSKTEE